MGRGLSDRDGTKEGPVAEGGPDLTEIRQRLKMLRSAVASEGQDPGAPPETVSAAPSSAPASTPASSAPPQPATLESEEDIDRSLSRIREQIEGLSGGVSPRAIAAATPAPARSLVPRAPAGTAGPDAPSRASELRNERLRRIEARLSGLASNLRSRKVERFPLEAVPAAVEPTPAPVRTSDETSDLASAIDDITAWQRALDQAEPGNEPEPGNEAETRQPGAIATPETSDAAETLSALDAADPIPTLGEATSAPAIDEAPEAEPAEIAPLVAKSARRAPAMERAADPWAGAGIDSLARQVERIERQLAEAGPSHTMRALNGHMRTLGERMDRLAASVGNSPGMVAMERSLAELSKRIEGNGTEDALAAMAARIDELSQRLDGVSAEAIDKAVSRALEAQLGKIEALVEKTTTKPLIASLEKGLRDLNSRLETIEKQDHGVEQIESVAEHVGQIAEAIEVSQKGMVDRVVKEMDRRVERLGILIERSGAEAPGDALRQIEGQLAEIQNRLAMSPASTGEGGLEAFGTRLDEIAGMIAIRPDTPAGQDAMREMQKQIAALAGKIDGVQAAGTSDTAIRQMEEQMARIAALIEGGQGGTDALAIAGIKAAIEENGRAAIDAARQVAEETVRQLAQMPGQAPETEDLIRTLRDSLSELRQSSETGERRQSDAFASVHDTLSRIVERLSTLERERSMPADFGSDAPGSTKAAGLDDPAMRNKPLEPGSGRPALPAPQTGASNEEAYQRERPTTSPSSDPAATRADFIAAARRAAQQAAADGEDGDGKTDDEPSERGPRRLGSALARIGAGKSRRRPLVLTAAAAVLVLGALHAQGLLPNAVLPGSLLPLGDSAQENASSQEPTDTVVAALPPAADAGDTAEPTDEAANTLAFSGPQVPAATFKPQESADKASPAEPATGDDVAGQAVAEVPAPPPAITSPALRAAIMDANPAALYEVGLRYTDAVGVERDLSEASRWYRLASELDLAPAQYRLGSMYEKGNGVPRDIGEAALWYEKAATAGNRMAMHNLGVLNAEGLSGQPDYQAAVDLFRQAGDLGLKDSQFNLGVIYGRGLGTPPDLVESYKWFDIAARSGDGAALQKREEVGAKLSADDLARAKALAAAWSPQTLDHAANDVPPAPAEWADASLTETSDATGAVDGDSPSQRILVQQVQALLIKAGYNPGPADGVMGGRTRDAVRAFERSRGLPETGAVTPDLVFKLSDADQEG